MTGQWLIVPPIVAAVAGARGTWSPCGLSMVSAINPLAERGRGYRYWLTALWFVAGALAGGALFGAIAAAAAWPIHALPASITALVGSLGCLVALACDCKVGRFRLPIHPRQVNERWLMQYRRWLYASGFGFQIGTGFATYIMTAATYLVVLLAALTGSPAWALITGLTFGLVRGAAVLLSSRCRSPESLRALHRKLDRLEPASRRAVVIVEAVMACVLAAGGGSVLAGLGALGVSGVLVAISVRQSTNRSHPVRPQFRGRRIGGRRPTPQPSGKAG
ncbi:MAG TPA: hypothetical protein VJ851_19205 [Jatrophihabitans sp.]|nr:hypothetical protein [Jatrophihabitans sp.]